MASERLVDFGEDMAPVCICIQHMSLVQSSSRVVMSNTQLVLRCLPGKSVIGHDHGTIKLTVENPNRHSVSLFSRIVVQGSNTKSLKGCEVVLRESDVWNKDERWS
jgi:hypothetical protein